MSDTKIHKWVKGKWQPDPDRPRYVVDCHLYDMHTTPDVYWSDPNKNSYVLVEVGENNSWRKHPEMMERYYWNRDGVWFEIASINGAGEVRWTLTKDRVEQIRENEKKDWWDPNAKWDDNELIAAARHFGLAPPYEAR